MEGAGRYFVSENIQYPGTMMCHFRSWWLVCDFPYIKNKLKDHTSNGARTKWLRRTVSLDAGAFGHREQVGGIVC